jgi:A118 family predicted phage portal protein
MALPAGGKIPWPPVTEAQAYMAYGEWSAWYSGAAVELERFYAGYAGQDRTGFFDPKTTAQPYTSIWRRFAFWARQDPGAIMRGRVHIPVASDVATKSSDLLFSDTPEILIPEAHGDDASGSGMDIEARLGEISDQDNIPSTLSEAGEIAAALGGVFMKVAWDADFREHPMLLTVHPDQAVPEFRYGKLNAVTFWKVVQNDGKTLYRHLERHEKGAILHGLYEGDQKNLGTPVALSKVPETADLVDLLTDGSTLVTNIPELTAVYIPNMLPNRGNRAGFLGRSDYAGAESMMDQLDEVWTSWMRDIRLGKSRLLVPREYMMNLGRGRGAQFDVDKEVYELVNLAPQASLKDQISPQQFAIRTKEHAETAETLLQRIIAATGYSAATFGLGGAENIEKTATEVKAKEKASLITRGKKMQYWSSALCDILYVLLEIDQKVFSGPGALRPRLEFPNVVHEATFDIAQSVGLLKTAQAISQRTMVEMVHPDWTDEEIDAECQAIKDEIAAAPPVVVVGAPPEQTPGGPPQPGQPAPSTGPTPGGPQPAAAPPAAAGPMAGGPPPTAM